MQATAKKRAWHNRTPLENNPRSCFYLEFTLQTKMVEIMNVIKPEPGMVEHTDIALRRKKRCVTFSCTKIVTNISLSIGDSQRQYMIKLRAKDITT